MPTTSLIDTLVARVEGSDPAGAVEVLHQLLDDSTIENDARPVGIAAAATLVGLTPHTLRYYEGQGLVRPSRSAAGHRLYGPAELRRLVFLVRMRVSGMPMQELTSYIALVDQGEVTIPERRTKMLAQRDRIDRMLRELTLAREATEFKLRVYGGAPG